MASNLEASGTHVMLEGVPVWYESTREWAEVIRSGADVVIRCLWADRFVLQAALLTPYVSPLGFAYTLRGQPYPEGGNRFVERIDIDGTDAETGATAGPTGQRAYKYALLKVKYSTPDLFVLQKWTMTMRQEQMIIYRDGSFMKLQDGANNGAIPPGYSFGQIIPVTRYVFQSAIMLDSDFEDKTRTAAAAPRNNAPFRGWAAGQVLYNGSEARPEPMTINLYRYCHEFICREKDWNQAPDSAGVWRTIVFTGSTTPLYQSSDLNTLIS